LVIKTKRGSPDTSPSSDAWTASESAADNAHSALGGLVTTRDESTKSEPDPAVVSDVVGKPVQVLGGVIDGRADNAAVGQVDDGDDALVVGAVVQAAVLGWAAAPTSWRGTAFERGAHRVGGRPFSAVLPSDLPRHGFDQERLHDPA
jgi:hypothetical protein